MMTIDLRSDTVTKPSPAMLDMMMSAPVGDDVFEEDPSVNQLEKMAAGMFAMEAAVFCPTGTMTNQIAIKCHTQPGDEVICHKLSHVYQYEGGGIAFNSGCQVKPIDAPLGKITEDQIKGNINPDDYHKARTSLVCLENTANRGGGACYDFSEILKIKEVCFEHHLGFHLDGARLFNALVAKNETAKQYGEAFDSISICLSKGLGAPVGSLLLGKNDFIKKARRWRKVFGGGMRQAGYLAAAGIYALENNIDRLAEDHKHAKMIGDALAQKSFISNILPVETNIVIFEVSGSHTPKTFADYLQTQNVLVSVISSTQIRMVTHLDISITMVEQLVKLISEL